MMKKNDLPRVLIVGTTPFNPNESSRALDTYFHNWPNDKLHMIYSGTMRPYNFFCNSYYQVTDFDVFKNFPKKRKVGRVIESTNQTYAIYNKDNKTNRLPARLKRKSVLRYYLRRLLWCNKRWLSDELVNWVKEFKPEIIYLCFSDDYFVLDIAYYFSKLLNLPIIVQIGDDYYFKKYNPLMLLYLISYKKIFKKIMNTRGFGVYISDKLSNLYNAKFKKQGLPIYLSSDISFEPKPIKYEFNYIGKINLGRDKSLAILGDHLKKVNKDFKINIYTKEISDSTIKMFKKHNCNYIGSIEYLKTLEIMNSGAVNIIASGFSKKNVEDARYSLSTKVADALASSGPILAIGPRGDGAIDYLSERNCALIIDKPDIDLHSFKGKLLDKKYLKSIVVRSKEVYSEEHNLKNNRIRFEEKCLEIVGERK